ncbi:DNA primase [Mycoplasmopsis edwardii]|nr:DNA primase [Mycoplasmopsis edwardii]
MSKIDLETIKNEILEKTDIVNVISNHISLNKKGNSFVGLCPFHQDTTPSFSVSQTKQLYKCFACQEGGNVISFIVKFLGKSYYEALELLAADLNIQFDFTSYKPSNTASKSVEDTESLEILNVVNSFYKIEIIKNQNAIKYLESRNLWDAEIRKIFDIGYAPSNKLLEYLNTNTKFNNNTIYNSGIVNANLKELFFNRITFAIRNNYGEVVGFSARALDNNEKPKYINSPETKLFKKSKILYNYHNAKEEINKQKKVYIVEGFMDVISLYKAGIHNTVAIMGTALTSDHLYLLNKHEVILFLDSDQAGRDATLKSIKTLYAGKVNNVSVVINTLEKDAGEILDKHGKETLLDVINQKVSAVDFIYESFVNKHNLRTNFKYNSVKDFNKDIKEYMLVLNYDQKSYISNRMKSEFNYDLIGNINSTTAYQNSDDDGYNQYYDDYYQPPYQEFLKQPFDQYYEQDNRYLTHTNKFNEIKNILASNIRIKFLIYFILKPELAKKFYNLENSRILFSKPESLLNTFDSIKEEQMKYFDLLNGQEEPTIKEIINNSELLMHNKIKKLIINLSQNISEKDVNDFYEKSLEEIKETISNGGKVSLNPLITEFQQAFKNENQEMKIVLNSKLNLNIKNTLLEFKDKKI